MAKKSLDVYMTFFWNILKLHLGWVSSYSCGKKQKAVENYSATTEIPLILKLFFKCTVASERGKHRRK